MAPSCWMVDQAWLGIHYMSTPTITMQGRNASLNAYPPASTGASVGASVWTAVDGSNNVVGTGTMATSASVITVASVGTWVGGSPVNPGYYTIYTNAGTNGVVTGTCVICPSGSNLYVPNSAGDQSYNLSAWLGGAADRDYYNLPGRTYVASGSVGIVFSNGSASVTDNNTANDGGFSALQTGALAMGQYITPGTTIAAIKSASVMVLSASVTGSTSTATMYVSTPVTNSANATVNGISTGIIAQAAADSYYAASVQDAARPHKLWLASDFQCNYPSQAPDPVHYWGAIAASISAAGHAGAYYECPTNEPENGGWSTANTVTYWNACASAILAQDPTAHVMGFCSGGIYNDTPITGVATFLSGTAGSVSAFTNHMENSHQNMSNIVMLREYLGGLKAQFASSGYPNLDLWLTETGIEPGQYSVLQPRREARQRTILRFVAESYGWAKENCYDFPVFDHQGSGLGTYLVDTAFGSNIGNMRAGAYALHILSEALYGTTCNPTNKPTTLSFGPAGSPGDSLFAGTHYTGSTRDVVILATNGLESDTVTLNVSNAASVSAWDGWGNTRTVTTSGNQITVAVDDLLTYVFLPVNTTVSVVDTGSKVISQINGAFNLAALAGTLVDGSSVSQIGVVNNNSFSENLSGITGVATPYSASVVPGSLTASKFWSNQSGQNVQGVALMTSGPAWQTVGCSITGFNIVATINGTPTTVYTYSSASVGTGAVSFAIPGACDANSSDITTRTTWWKNPFAWIVPLSLSGPATSIKLNITGTSYGGQPDLAASNAGENDPQEIILAEFQIYQAGNNGTGPQSLMRAVG